MLRTRTTVLQATREILGERGYQGFTVEAVFRRTGVAKTTIYRHWPRRADLLHDALTSVNRGGQSVTAATFVATC